MAFGNGHNGIHVARDTGVMDGRNGFGARGNGDFDQAFVNVKRIFPNIDKHGHTDEGIGRRYEGVRGHDDFVTGLGVQQQQHGKNLCAV